MSQALHATYPAANAVVCCSHMISKSFCSVFFSMWWCPWTILWPYEAVWSWGITQQHAVSFSRRLRRSRILQYWGKLERENCSACVVLYLVLTVNTPDTVTDKLSWSCPQMFLSYVWLLFMGVILFICIYSDLKTRTWLCFYLPVEICYYIFYSHLCLWNVILLLLHSASNWAHSTREVSFYTSLKFDAIFRIVLMSL